MLRKSSNPSWLLLLLMWLLAASSAFGQGTSFTYQGKLTDSSSPANGTYDFQFKLFDTAALGTGTQFGTTQTLTSVAVSSGIFTVQLDFGACPACFNGAVRFLEIAVKPTSSGTLTTLDPRQPLSSTPYAIRSLNAAAADGLSVACVNCVTSGQIGSVSGSAVSGTIPVASVPPGSGSYIQNTTTQQAASNFNISGSGVLGGTLSANSVDATTQFNIGGSRVLSVIGSDNLFAGIGAGSSNTIGGGNSFFGPQAGFSNTQGGANSFFGLQAGLSNTSGSANSFFGRATGSSTNTGFDNSFFGSEAGFSNTTGSYNSFLGKNAGRGNTSGQGNTFAGLEAGFSNTTGGENAFFGTFAGWGNTTGNYNTMVGRGANVGAGGLNNATALGSNASVGCSNCLVLGSINGVNGATADVNVGIGTINPQSKLHVYAGLAHAGVFGESPNSYGVHGISNTNIGVEGDSNTYIGVFGSSGSSYGVYGYSPTFVGVYGFSGSGIGVAGHSISGVAGYFEGRVSVEGTLEVDFLGAAGGTTLCRNASNEIATCSSSLRYKSDVRPFSGGLEILNRLRPIAFTWKQGGAHDIGLAAEEVEEVEPLLITHNDKGEIEGVKYDRVAVVLVNAVKEQQAQIALQRRQLAQQVELLQRQQAQVEELKKLVCLDHPAADVCK